VQKFVLPVQKRPAPPKPKPLKELIEGTPNEQKPPEPSRLAQLPEPEGVPEGSFLPPQGKPAVELPPEPLPEPAAPAVPPAPVLPARPPLRSSLDLQLAPGINAALARQLREQGVSTLGDLLDTAAEGLDALTALHGIGPAKADLLLAWYQEQTGQGT
jgi:hypothetical protein